MPALHSTSCLLFYLPRLGIRVCPCYFVPQPKKRKEVKGLLAPVIKGSHASTEIKPEPQQAGNTDVSCAWPAKNNLRDRGDVLPGKVHESAATVVSNGSDAAADSRGRDGQGHWRGEGRPKAGRPPRAEATVRSPEGERHSGSVDKVSTPVPQECAERKEGESPDLSSSARKSPRSKEVRV